MIKLADLAWFLALSAPLSTPLTAQNLFAWNNWTRVGPQWQVNYSVTQQQISFNPYCGRPAICNVRPRTGISQQVQVPSAGKYVFRFRGDGGGTGTFQTEFKVNGRKTDVWHDNWHVAAVLDLPAGPVKIEISTDTSNLLVDYWRCAQPELTAALEPAVDVWVTDAGDPNSVRVILQAEATVLAASVQKLNVPLAIPSLNHGLELDPAGMVILAMSPTNNIYLDLSREASQLGYRTWAKTYLQALSPRSFGSLSWF